MEITSQALCRKESGIIMHKCFHGTIRPQATNRPSQDSRLFIRKGKEVLV